MLKDVSRAFSLLDKQRRRRFARLLVVALVTSLLEAVGVSLAFTLIRIILEPDLIGQMPAVRSAMESIGVTEHGELFTIAAISMAVFFLAKNLFLAYATFIQQKFTFGSASQIATTLLTRYLTAPYDLIFTRNSADLLVGVNQSSYMVASRIYGPTVVIITEGLVLCGIISVLLYNEPIVTTTTALFLVVFLAAYHRVISPFYRKWGSEQLTLERKQAKTIYECLHGLKELKVLSREPFFIRSFIAGRQRLERLTTLVATVNLFPRLVTETILIWAIAVVILIVMQEGRSVPSIMATLSLFALAGFRMMPSVNRLTVATTAIKHGASALDRVTADLEHFRCDEKGDRSGIPDDTPRFEKSLEVRGVSYAYPGAQKPAVTDISFQAIKGQSIGIVGSSGAGKTTLVDIVLGLLEPSSGYLILDGREVQTKTSAWRRMLGYVPQEISLIDDTLRRNIAIGINDVDINEDNISRVVRMAALDDVVAQLPEGVDTIIGERGTRLSGGQRQRIGIARALYHNPDILVMDEATSALDPETEQEIINAIATLAGEKTVITIAHRLTTVQNCDQLIFMLDGKIAATGTFSELRSSNPAFDNLVRLAEIKGGEL
jgi:ABC-type multidrug transport system fused ATPase/permease subunit